MIASTSDNLAEHTFLPLGVPWYFTRKFEKLHLSGIFFLYTNIYMEKMHILLNVSLSIVLLLIFQRSLLNYYSS